MHYFPVFSLTISFNESKRFSGNRHLKKTSRVKWIEENRGFSNNYLSFICLFNFLPLHFSGTHVRTVHTLSSKTCALKYKKTWLLKKRTFLKLRHPSQQSRHKKFKRKRDFFQTHQKSCREGQSIIKPKFFEVQFATPSQGTRLRGFWGRHWRSPIHRTRIVCF